VLPPSDLSQIVLCGGAGGSPARLCDKPLRSKELLVTSWCSVQLETTARSPFRTLNQRVQGSSPCAPTIEINDVAQHTRLATTHLQFGLQLCWRFERADGVNRHRRIEKPSMRSTRSPDGHAVAAMGAVGRDACGGGLAGLSRRPDRPRGRRSPIVGRARNPCNFPQLMSPTQVGREPCVCAARFVFEGAERRPRRPSGQVR
jgi:hypothetical protein